MPTASTTKKSRPLFVATGSASGATAPETNAYIFERVPEPHRCWLIQLRKRSLKPSQSTDACEREKRCYQCHQGKTGFTGYCWETDWGVKVGMTWVDNGTTNLRQGRVRIRQIYACSPLEDMELYQSFTDGLWSCICGAGRCSMAVPKHLRFYAVCGW